MASTQVQKRSAAKSSAPLLDSAVLQIVLSYVGPGHHLFVPLVSKAWLELYEAVDYHQLTIPIEYSHEQKIITIVPQMTLYSSVFGSPSRAQLAHENGLDCTSEAYQRAAGRHADIATLAAAHSLGMEYTTFTMIRESALLSATSLPKCSICIARGAPGPCGCSKQPRLVDTTS
jgi:hypothetical protein